MKQQFFFICFLFICLSSFAQLTDKIETDRPDQTESPFITPKKFLQSEFGFNLMKYKGDIKQLLHPTSLLKYGLNNRMELRLEVTPYTEYLHFIPNTISQTKLEPVAIGTKVRLFEEKGLRPKTSLIAHLGLPFLASKEFRSGSVLYIARFALQNTISEVLSLGYNIGIEGNEEAKTSLFYSLSPGFNIGEKWYAYIESFGAFSTDEPEHNLDGGIAFSPSNHTKIDLSAGFGLGNSPLKNYAALGFSFRLPLK